MINAILIDDIEQARTTLKKDLETYTPEVTVIGEAGGVIEGAKLLKKITPDVLFLDIQMQDGSGFDLLDILTDIRFHIIFITASDAYAIKAFQYAAIQYLVKPVDPDKLIASVEQLKTRLSNESERYRFLNEALKSSSKVQTRLALNTQEKIHIVNMTDILRCESNVNYTEFFFTNHKKIVVTKTLKEFEEILTPHGFYRVHQSHLINTAYLKEFIKSDDELLMTDDTRIPVSSRRRAEVMKMLEGL